MREGLGLGLGLGVAIEGGVMGRGGWRRRKVRLSVWAAEESAGWRVWFREMGWGRGDEMGWDPKGDREVGAVIWSED